MDSTITTTSASDSQAVMSLPTEPDTRQDKMGLRRGLKTMPPEMIYEIAKYMSQATKARVAQTCRRLRTLMDQALLDQDGKEDRHALWWASVNNEYGLLERILKTKSVRAYDLANYRFLEVHTFEFTFNTSRQVKGLCRSRKGADHSLHLTPLTVAIQFGNDRAITVLLEQGADVNLAVPSPSMGPAKLWYPLHWAVRVLQSGRQFHDVVGLLIKHGSSINQAPLLQGPFYQHEDEIPIFEFLSFVPSFRKKSSRKHPDAEYERQLESRCRKFESLLQLGADPNVRAPVTGQTPIFKTAKALSEYDPKSPFVGQHPLRHEIDRVYEEVVVKHAIQIFRSLARRGGKVNTVCEGTTALHLLCKRSEEHQTLIKCMLRLGASINAIDSLGQTPIYAYVMYPRHHKLLAKFIQAGAKVNHRDKMGRTPLHVVCAGYLVCHSKLQDTITTLLAHGADPNMQDAQGNTPLELLEARRNPTWKDTRTILHRAVLKASGVTLEETDDVIYSQEELEAWNRPFEDETT
ncbi:ankyrin [Daldinia caldariorum]|uniref:ankyrin n=1 Tax=Daldinia caldariorum TaxID=326644 RepID=UPI002007DF2C|nr:ankyrin [Daldinia caldariorum]KAI1464451.1 ankyrin [Daldinia caldariorum]